MFFGRGICLVFVLEINFDWYINLLSGNGFGLGMDVESLLMDWLVDMGICRRPEEARQRPNSHRQAINSLEQTARPDGLVGF
jgi:hypothetical protein